MTILEILQRAGYRVKAVVPYVTNKAVQQVVADPQLVMGVELEIEHADEAWKVAGMDVTTDGSLRGGGLEYVTKPMTGSVLFYVLETFFNKAKPAAHCYSDRTSIHVHANVQDLTAHQLSAVLLLYQVFENQLFRFAGQDRDKNIFCVPWNQTAYTYNIGRKILDGTAAVAARWAKYTALNLAPMTAQGTIEFRHMPGTADIVRIKEWCNLIGCLFVYARKADLPTLEKELCALNTNSQYQLFVDKVFGRWAHLMKYPAFEIDLEDGVLNAKYMLLDKTGEAAEARGNRLLDAFNAVQEAQRRLQQAPPVAGDDAPNFVPNGQWFDVPHEQLERQVLQDAGHDEFLRMVRMQGALRPQFNDIIQAPQPDNRQNPPAELPAANIERPAAARPVNVNPFRNRGR